MNNPKYRIKIEEKNNGQKSYTAQVSFKKTWLGKPIWYNIISSTLNGGPSDWVELSISEDTSVSWDSYEKAMKVIEMYKEQLKRKLGKQIKSITYKEIE